MTNPTSIAGAGAGGTLRPLSRLGDITTGHQCWAPTIGTTASPNVFCNGQPVHMETNTFTPHSCGTDVHPDVAAKGSTTVRVNGLGVMRLGDVLAPGGALMAQSTFNVFAKS